MDYKQQVFFPEGSCLKSGLPWWEPRRILATAGNFCRIIAGT